MDASKIDQLRLVKDRFRALTAKGREALSIAMLKVNLGVNSPEDLRLAGAFLGNLPLELKKGKLDAFMDFLHTASAITPPDISGWYSPEDFTANAANSGLPGYREDEVETLKDDVKPFGKERW